MEHTTPSPAEAPTLTIAQAVACFDPRLPNQLVRIHGEVSDVSRASARQHCYFTLSDGTAQIPCVLWKRVAKGLSAWVSDGLQVEVLCWVQTSPRGQIELDIRSLSVRSERGPRASARDELRSALTNDGILNPTKRRSLPSNARCIGVVTSLSGDVIHDIVRVIRRRAPGTLVHTVSTRVTGAGAAAEIADAIRMLGAAGTSDVIVVARGGGSAADLAAFDCEEVVRAIAESPVPVISAIGHETDNSLADEAADMRAATPSEAAEIAIADRAGSDSNAGAEAAAELHLQIGGAVVVVRVPTASSAPVLS